MRKAAAATGPAHLLAEEGNLESRFAQGVLTGATKIVRDIRAQAHAAQALAVSEAHDRALSQASPLGVFATDALQAQRVAPQTCDCMDDFRLMHDERRFRIGTSIGLVPVDNRWGSTAALILAADTSCYAAKEAGRNRVHAGFDTDQAMRARHGEMPWAARLEQALDENRFARYAQRIEALDANRHGLLDDAAVRCFIDLARVVGVETVAGFVDRVEVLDRVHEIGIDFAQGFLLHRPEPIESVLGSHAGRLHPADVVIAWLQGGLEDLRRQGHGAVAAQRSAGPQAASASASRRALAKRRGAPLSGSVKAISRASSCSGWL